MHTVITYILFFLLNTSNLQHQATYSVTIEVKNIENNKGEVLFAIYNSENEFLKTPFKGEVNAIKNNTSTIIFNDIPKGVYAVSVYHDKNSNRTLDTNFLGMPKEDYGCSNDARGFMSAPKWNDAKFLLNSNKKIEIEL